MTANDEKLEEVVARRVPPGSWAVGVSGGADSVALLSLVRGVAGVRVHVVHLDHQLRGEESAADARFVAELAERWGVACTVARRDEIEAGMKQRPANPSALYRAMRLEVYGRVAREHALDGVILAHHADDQAETVLQRLLRGSGPAGLAGMADQTSIGGLVVLRPVLGVRREALREYLRGIGQDWREDSSNASDAYQRNRVRRTLGECPELTGRLIEMAEAMARWCDWLAEAAPVLPAAWPVGLVRDLPPPVAAEAVRRWLVERGVPAEEASGATPRVLEMALDAASPGVWQLARGVRVRRRERRVFVEGAG